MPFNRIAITLFATAALAHGQFFPNIFATPATIAAGSGDTTLTISGANFKPSLQVYWNGQPRPTTFVSGWTLKALIPGSDLAQTGRARISLWDSDCGCRASNDAAVLVDLPLHAWDMVYDSVRSRIYASISQTDENGPSLAVIDPDKGIVERYSPLPNEPGVIALSDDARYLYVTMKDRVRRIDLSGATPDLDISYPEPVFSPSPLIGPANAILPLPGDGTSFLLSLGLGGDIFAIDGATPRPNNAGQAKCLEGVRGGTVYGGPGFTVYSLGASGITYVSEMEWDSDEPACPVYAGGLLYSSDGEVLDPSGFTLKGTFAALGPLDVAPERGQSYFLNYEAALTLMVFDIKSHALLSATRLPSGAAGKRIIHWGADGIAFGQSSDSFSPMNGICLLHITDLN